MRNRFPCLGNQLTHRAEIWQVVRDSLTMLLPLVHRPKAVLMVLVARLLVHERPAGQPGNAFENLISTKLGTSFPRGFHRRVD